MGGCPFCRSTVSHTLLLLMLTFSPSDCELLIQAEIWIFYFMWQGAGGFQKALNKCQVTRGMHSRRKCNADICQALDGCTVGCWARRRAGLLGPAQGNTAGVPTRCGLGRWQRKVVAPGPGTCLNLFLPPRCPAGRPEGEGPGQPPAEAGEQDRNRPQRPLPGQPAGVLRDGSPAGG